MYSVLPHCSAILPCRTFYPNHLSDPILPQTSSSYTGLFSYPTLLYPVIHPTTSYKSSCIPNTSLCTPSYPILLQTSTLSYILPGPTLDCSSTTTLVAFLTQPHSTLSDSILPQTSSSYTGLSSHPTLCSPVLPR